MIPTTAFLPRLLPYVIGCTQTMALQALVDSAISFCEDSLVIRQRLDRQLTALGQAEFDIGVTAPQSVTRILKVWLDGVEIYPAAADIVNDQVLAQARPRTFYTLPDDTGLMAVLYPVPDKAYTLDAEVALKPTRDAASLHSDLFGTWLEGVVEGAKARLMAIPDQPFSNPAYAQTCAMQAASMAKKARIEGAFGRVRGSLSIKPRLFA